MNKTCGIAHRHTHCLWSCYRFVLSCAQQNNGPQRCLHPNPWSLGPCQVTRQRGAKVADGTKLLIDHKTGSEVFHNLPKSHSWNTNPVLTSRASIYFQTLYFTGGKTKVREVAAELWATSQDRKPGALVPDPRDRRAF